MVKTFAALFLLATCIVSPSSAVINHKFFRGIDGGLECATCTVLVGLVDQLAEVHNNTFVDALNNQLCDKLPHDYSKSCHAFAEILGPILVKLVAEGANPDDICRGLGLCYTQPGQKQCALYKKTVKLDDRRVRHYQQMTRLHLKHKWGVKLISPNVTWSICDLPIVDYLCSFFTEVYEQELPAVDDDGDLHSTYGALRGVSWRGRDCDDTNRDSYPGRKPGPFKDAHHDYNCNGISGFDDASGKSYEETFCENTGQRGVVVIGDSVGAHFHAPQEWFDPQLLTEESLKDLPFALENELDWPQLSLVTGYMNSTWSVAQGPMDSIYSRIVERNRCNHRNYQNIALNGDDSFEVYNLSKTLRMNKETDYPLLIVIELVGNDVCNRATANETLDAMTTEKQMHDNLVRLLTSLNETVPAESKVLIVGMADGDFLYQFLGNRYHPFGRWRKDLKYKDIYDWWNCMQVTPCIGWLNKNATLRKLTTERANNLSRVMSDLSKSHQHYWANLELAYLNNPITNVIKEYIFKHGNGTGYQLIEPVDGFHPNQKGQALSAAAVWDYMVLNNLTTYLGPLNPHNDAIKKKFGDQGGY